MLISRSDRLKRRRVWLNKIKTGAGCIDCGYNKHGVALHFDHKDRHWKSANVSQMVGSTLKSLFIEIRKCEVRCANCHAVKTVQEKENVPLGDVGRKVVEIDSKKESAAWWLWRDGASIGNIAKKTKLTKYKVSQAVAAWNATKEQDRKKALEDPEGPHPWDKVEWEVITPHPPLGDDPSWANLDKYDRMLAEIKRYTEYHKTKTVEKFSRPKTYTEYFVGTYGENPI